MKMSYRGEMLQNNRWEAGFSLGVANAMTDIAAGTANTQASIMDVYSRGLSPAVSIHSRYRFGDPFSLRFNATALMLRGNDRWSSDIDVVNRGKSFTNTLMEGSLLAEFYLPRTRKKTNKDFTLQGLDFFLFTGLATFYHSPEVKGPIIDDYDQSLLNADNIYSQYQVAVPVGAGFLFKVGSRVIMGMDFSFRYTFFDYLDGFRRPYSTRNDFYFTSSLSLGYIISSKADRTNNSSAPHIFRR
jgi:hypothetical protein